MWMVGPSCYTVPDILTLRYHFHSSTCYQTPSESWLLLVLSLLAMVPLLSFTSAFCLCHLIPHPVSNPTSRILFQSTQIFPTTLKKFIHLSSLVFVTNSSGQEIPSLAHEPWLEVDHRCAVLEAGSTSIDVHQNRICFYGSPSAYVVLPEKHQR